MNNIELQSIKNKYDLVGNDATFNTALETAVAVAPTDLTVLVIGESGVGKESLPQIIHQNSRRKNSKYFAVNCGAIPEGTIDSELFGHEKGSFTGAIETRKGYFEVADGGTLFLDEIGELPKESQAKLLRVLQNGEFIKVGSSKVQKTDVRVVAATNVDLVHAVRKGDFREDLFFRLNAIQIKMPALRERKADIYLLFRKFASDFSEKYGMKKLNLSHEAIAILKEYRWPGNIRQLKNFTETICALESQKIDSLDRSRFEIDGATLMKYMPSEDINMLPSSNVVNNADAMSSSEKQMLIKAIFDLKRDVDSLKNVVFGNSSSHATQSYIPQIGARNSSMSDISSGTTTDGSIMSNLMDSHQHHPAEAHSSINAANESWYDNQENADDLEPEDQIDMDEHEEQEESHSNDLSFRKAGKLLIKKALDKHDGNRKKAAEELGISERTLYRKLPEEYKNRRKKS